MFESIKKAPRDAILGLTEAFQSDPNPAKINLSVGVYKDAQGQTPVLPSVKMAEERLVREESTKGYLPIDGSPAYNAAVQGLLFGASHEVVTSGRAVTSQAPGGTGALRVAANFLAGLASPPRIWLSKPTWPNHPGIFRAAGLRIEDYPYFDPGSNGLDLDGMLSALGTASHGDVVLLHGCCHNPTGIDPTPEQWNQIAQIVQARGLVPLIDFAYQGFAEGLREDTTALDVFGQPGNECIVCSSFSKNIGLYRERVGALTMIAATPSAAEAVQSQVKAGIRTNYSNPPSHGAAIAATILGDAELRTQWEGELAEMRHRIHSVRRLFVETLTSLGVAGDYSFVARQRGMFSFSGLTPEQVDRLREQYSIYIVRSGRINVAGMTEANMGTLCQAIAEVVQA